jgi:hypothetical protein
MVVLLNILIALYNSAYEDVTDNATDEYMALFASKTMQFVRAPDENVFIAPLNLVEIFCLILPFEWWMNKKRYERLNDYVMAVIYSPLLVFTAALETKQAHRVRTNKKRGAEDDDVVEEWEQLDNELDFENDGWGDKVMETRPNVQDNPVQECKILRKEVGELKGLIEKLLEERGLRTEDGESSKSGRYPTPGAE